MLKLKLQLQYFGHMMQRANPVEKTLMQGKSEAGEQDVIEDEMVGWYHQLNGDEFEQALRIGDGQGSLVCYTPWCCKESDTTELLSNSKWKPKLWRTMQINRGVGMNHVFMLSC